MKLIMRYVVGDGYTFDATVIYPIEYESAEALICDFDKALDEAAEKRIHKHHYDCSFQFGIEKFNLSDFLGKKRKILPEILTIDEWFNKENINP
jgi:hypothetical protein